MKQFTNWSPLHFLSMLGAGGIVVSFFMYLLFWIPHPEQPIPVFSDWFSHLQTASLSEQGMINIALGGFLMIVLQLLTAWLLLRLVSDHFAYNKQESETLPVNTATQS